MVIRLETFLMGAIDVDEKDILFFPRGLPGFEKLHRWILAGEDGDSLKWLVSADCGGISLPVTSPLLIDEKYDPAIPLSAEEELQITDPADSATLVVLNLPGEDPRRGTANLLAPILINSRTRKGKQVVLSDERYSVSTPVFPPEHPGNGKAGEI